MKKISSICMAAILLAGISSAVQPARAEAGNSGMEYGMQLAGKPKKELKTVTFSVNMHCEKCVEKIMENISYEKGVKGLEISLEDKTVKIVYDILILFQSCFYKSVLRLGNLTHSRVELVRSFFYNSSEYLLIQFRSQLIQSILKSRNVC